jgi:hypothetical protein
MLVHLVQKVPFYGIPFKFTSGPQNYDLIYEGQSC